MGSAPPETTSPASQTPSTSRTGRRYLPRSCGKSLAALTGQRAYGDARCWSMIDMVRMQLAIAAGVDRDLSQDVPEGLAEAREKVNAMLDALANERPSSRLVLGGFSQGAMLSLDVALRAPSRKLAGLVQMSARSFAEPEWKPLLGGRKELKVFQSHGRADAILPFAAAERLSKMLSDAGLEVTFDPFHGPHTNPRPDASAFEHMNS